MDLFGLGAIGSATINTAGQIAINEAQMDLQKSMFEAQMDWSAESFYKNLEFQHKMTNQAQDFQREMWQRQIDYNDPSAAMQRLMSAGINPNSAAAMLGGAGGAAVSGSVSSPSGASASIPNGTIPPLRNPMESIGELPAALLQQQSIKQSIATEKSKQNLNDAQSRNIDEQTKGLIIDNDWKPFEKQANIDQAYSLIDLQTKQGELNVQEATQIKEMLPYLKSLNVAQQYKLFAETDKTFKELQQIDANIALLSEQINTEKAKQNSLDAAAYQAYMAGEASQSVISYNGALMGVAEAEARLKQLEGDRRASQNAYEDVLRGLGMNPEEHNPIVSMFSQAGQVLNLGENYIGNLWQKIRNSYDPVQEKLHSYGSASAGFR